MQTVKNADLAEANLLARGEWEDRVAENRPDPQAPCSGSRLPVAAAGNLHPLFVTIVTRETIEIEPRPGTRIQAAVDIGEIRAIDSDLVEPISEIELELESGDPAALYDLALELLETAPLRIETRSKSERGYRLTAGGGAAATGGPGRAHRPRSADRRGGGDAAHRPLLPHSDVAQRTRGSCRPPRGRPSDADSGAAPALVARRGQTAAAGRFAPRGRRRADRTGSAARAGAQPRCFRRRTAIPAAGDVRRRTRRRRPRGGGRAGARRSP